MKTRIRGWAAVVVSASLVLGGIGTAQAQHSGMHFSPHGVRAYGGWGGYGHYRGGYYGHYGYYGWGGVGLGLGLYFATLPWYYSTYWWGGVPYYYADGSYYLWDGGARAYVTVAPPGGQGQGAAAAASAPTELFMYPKSGQSTEQQAKDRYECHRWAADQTGFDPTNPPPAAAPAKGVAATAPPQREDYIRAETACLEGRDYSVK